MLQMIVDFFYIMFQVVLYYICIQDYKTTFINICNRIAKINIFYIKTFQWFTYDLTNDPVLNEELYEYTSSFCNKVPYDPNDICQETIEYLQNVKNEKGEPVNTMDKKPINCGTIALCYKGSMEGKPVIIKILRKDIHLKLKVFFDQLDFLFGICQKLENWYFINKGSVSFLKKIIDSSKNDFMKQVDFLQECKNIQLFYDTYEDSSIFRIPMVYSNFTKENKHVLVMEFLQETYNITNIPKHLIPEYWNHVLTFMFYGYLAKYLFHCDLHFGNILFMEENEETKIGIIDFGFIRHVETIPEQDQLNELWDFILSSVNDETNAAINILLFIKKSYYELNSCPITYAKLNTLLEEQQTIQRMSGYTTSENHTIVKIILFVLKEQMNIHPVVFSTILTLLPFSGVIKKFNEVNDRKKGVGYNMLLDFKNKVQEFYST